MGRQRYALSAAAMGAVAALLVYGFGVRGLGLNHGLRSVYTIASAVLLIASRRLVRDVSERPRVVWLVAAFVIGAAIASAAAVIADPPPSLHRLSTFHLPGFSVDLPSGKRQPGSRDYFAGMYGVELDKDAVVLVGWNHGDGSREELEQMAGDARTGIAAEAIDMHFAKLADRDTAVIELRGDRGALRFTTVPCDGRVVWVESIGVTESMHARIVRSIACTPEPHAPEEAPVVLDPAGLPLVENKDGYLVYATPAKAVLMAGALPLLTNRSTLRDASQALLARLALTEIEMLPSDGDKLLFHATGGGARGTGMIRGVACAKRTVLVLGFVWDPALQASVASSVDGAHCK